MSNRTTPDDGPDSLPRMMSAERAFENLKRLGYTGSQADLAMNRAVTRGSWDLSRHTVTYRPAIGRYLLTERAQA